MKKGIAIVALVIVILVLSILATITAFSATQVIINSKLSNFTTNMSKIENAVTSYYATRGILPIVENSTAYTKNELVNLTNIEFRTAFLNEISKNGDDNSEFYYVDIAKIGVEDAVYNITSSSNSVVVNSSGTHIYLVDGYKINDSIYFSITQNME